MRQLALAESCLLTESVSLCQPHLPCVQFEELYSAHEALAIYVGHKAIMHADP